MIRDLYSSGRQSTSSYRRARVSLQYSRFIKFSSSRPVPEHGGRTLVEVITPDDQVLALRSAGRSFGAIANAVGMARGRDALEAFHRALRRRDPAEQVDLRADELRRLASLSTRLEASGRLTQAEVAAQLRVVARLRELLLAP
jgi:hypothetical protein